MKMMMALVSRLMQFIMGHLALETTCIETYVCKRRNLCMPRNMLTEAHVICSLHIISRRSIKTVIKLTLATLMHSKIKDFNFIRIISRISKKQLLQRASKVLSNHIKIISQ